MAQPREVTARATEAAGESGAHGIVGSGHDDGNRRTGIFERTQHQPRGDDHVDREPEEFGGQAGPALRSALTAAGLGHEIRSIGVAEPAQPLQERAGVWAPRLWPNQLGGREGVTEDPDPVDLPLRLGEDPARPGEDSECEARDEDTPVHRSLTSSPGGRSPRLDHAEGRAPASALVDFVPARVLVPGRKPKPLTG